MDVISSMIITPETRALRRYGRIEQKKNERLQKNVFVLFITGKK
jgi:hypothetical protein